MIKESAFFHIGTMSNSLSELHTLSLLNITAIPPKAPKIISVTWYPPISGWIKVNTDGSIIGTPSCFGAGGVFKNLRGYVIGAFSLIMELVLFILLSYMLLYLRLGKLKN